LQSDGADVDDLCDGLRRLEARYAEFKKAAASKRDLTWESQEATVTRIAGTSGSPAIKTVCLLPVATDARIQRRLAAFARLGVEPTVLAFERPYYPGKPITGGYQSLGRVEHGKYFSRLRPLLFALPKVRSACKTADVVYAFSLDLLALAWLATRMTRRRPRFVYEVADIHPTLVGRGVRAAIMRGIERKLLNDSSLLVVTSEAFITGFYRDIQGMSGLRYQLVENKPELDAGDEPAPRPRLEQPHITIGYFGVLRCERSWRVLRRLAEQGQGRIKVYLRGVPLNIPNFEAEARESPWVEYGGPYVAPDELRTMYDQIDLLWVAHRVDENNSLLWNRTNRFYEGCAFQKPMIAQVGTQDCTVVIDRGLGLAIDLLNPDAVVDRIARITPSDLEQWQSSVSRLPRSVYRENGEHEQLTRQIRALANAS
jgi:succinoglycan biosynthesis protein ExoL